MARQYYELSFTNRGQASKEQPYLAVLDLDSTGDLQDQLAGHLRASAERTGEDPAYLSIDGRPADENGQVNGDVAFHWSSGRLDVAA